MRQWFGHDPKRWQDVRERYEAELMNPAIREIIEAANDKPVITLVYSAKDNEHNQAVVFEDVFERLVRSKGHKTTRGEVRGRKIKQLLDAGQSVWLDNMSRALLTSGDLRGMMEQGVRGVTARGRSRG